MLGLWTGLLQLAALVGIALALSALTTWLEARKAGRTGPPPLLLLHAVAAQARKRSRRASGLLAWAGLALPPALVLAAAVLVPASAGLSPLGASADAFSLAFLLCACALCPLALLLDAHQPAATAAVAPAVGLRLRVALAETVLLAAGSRWVGSPLLEAAATPPPALADLGPTPLLLAAGWLLLGAIMVCSPAGVQGRAGPSEADLHVVADAGPVSASLQLTSALEGAFVLLAAVCFALRPWVWLWPAGSDLGAIEATAGLIVASALALVLGLALMVVRSLVPPIRHDGRRTLSWLSLGVAIVALVSAGLGTGGSP